MAWSPQQEREMKILVNVIPYFRKKISVLLTVSLVMLALVGGAIVPAGVVSTTIIITPAEAAFAQRPGPEPAGSIPTPTCPAPYTWDPDISSCSTSLDTDGDGVPDSTDRCLHTPSPKMF
jgi:hypothetical protein